MARTVINISEIINSSVKADSAKKAVSDVETRLRYTKTGIDSKIMNRNNINGRLNNVQNLIRQIEEDISRIHLSINNGALQYRNTERIIVGYVNSVTGSSVIRNPYKKIGNRGQYDLYFCDVTTVLSEKNVGEDTENKDWLNWVQNNVNVVNSSTDFLTDYILNEGFLLPGKMLYDGVSFKTYTGKGGKVFIKMNNYNELTHTEIADLLKRYVTEDKFTDYDIRRLVNDGLPLYSAHGNIIKDGGIISKHTLSKTKDVLELTKVLEGHKSIPSKIKNSAVLGVDTFKDEFNYIKKGKQAKEVFDFSNFKTLSNMEKVDDVLLRAGKAGNGLGLVGDGLTVIGDVYDNFHNPETGSWDFNLKNGVGCVSDVAIDLGTGAASAGAGAAIGSFFAPPVGTVVGAVAGLAVDAFINWEIDADGDGEKRSCVGVIKDSVDAVIDKCFNGESTGGGGGTAF